jgi:hypothetical protein
VNVFAAAILVAALGQAGDAAGIRVLDRGGGSGIEEARQQVVTSAAAFATLWREHAARPQPPVDFAKESVVALFLGMRRTAGYSVEIVGLVRQPEVTVVRYRELTPPAGSVSAQVLTFPYVIAAVPRLDSPVRFELVP